MSKLQIIYITGLGDQRATGQKVAVALWRLYGVQPHFFQANWADSELFAPKLERLLALIDELHEKSAMPVGVVAVSAGATAAMNVFAARRRKICGVVTICGKILAPEKVSPVLRDKNPAFSESMDQVAASLKQLSESDRQKILSVYSSGDRRVPMAESMLQGAELRKVGRGSHYKTIMSQVTFGARKNLQFLKRI